MQRFVVLRTLPLAAASAVRFASSSGKPHDSSPSEPQGKAQSNEKPAAATSSETEEAIPRSPPPPHVPHGLDAKAAEQMKIATELGQEAFEENTAILKQVAARGLRAFVVCAVGLAAFSWAMRRKRKQLQEEKVEGSAAVEEDDRDPTQRYLEEMRGIGFDVDTLEEELEQERREKAAAAAKAGRK